MKHLFPRLSLIAIFAFLVSACSPHPGTGVWKAVTDNNLGINKLIVGFEGRAKFVSKKPKEINWHCFWGAPKEEMLSLDCSPSVDAEETKVFTLTVNDQDLAELRDGKKLLATFTRLDENPSPKK